MVVTAAVMLCMFPYLGHQSASFLTPGIAHNYEQTVKSAGPLSTATTKNNWNTFEIAEMNKLGSWIVKMGQIVAKINISYRYLWSGKVF